MATREEALAELYKRGKLSDTQRSAVEELAKRGRIQLEATQQTPDELIADSADGSGGLIDKAVGVAEAGLTMASGALAEPISGIAGLAKTITSGPEAGAQTVEDVQKGLTYDPRTPEGISNLEAIGGNQFVQAVGNTIKKAEQYMGDTGYDLTGSPVMGALSSAIPALAIELAGTLAPPVLAGKRAGKMARGFEQTAENIAEQMPTARASEEGITAIADIADKPKEMANLAEMAQPDPAVLQAAKELGFDELPPAVMTNNPQFRELSMSLASIPGKSADEFANFVQGMSAKADELIKEGGGEIDKALLSNKFRNESGRVVKELGEQESVLYRGIEETVGKGTEINTDSLRQFVDQEALEMGGMENLSKPMQDIAKLVYRDGEAIAPTYANFESVRKAIGQAKGKKGGPFGEASDFEIGKIYGAMKDQQKQVLDEFELTDVLDNANALTIKRKALEKTLVDVLGKNLSKDLMPAVATKIKGAAKSGKITEFESLINNVPKDMRSEVVVSALNDLLGGVGANQKGFGVSKFADFMGSLDRSPTAKKAIYKHIPEQTQKSLENFSTLAKSLKKASDKTITTGRIQTVFDVQRPLLEKLVGFGKGVISAKTAGVGGRVVDEASENLVNYLGTPSARMNKANDLMASKDFQKLMQDAVSDGVHEGNYISRKTEAMENALENSAKYKGWADTLPGSEMAKLKSMGLTNYLLEPVKEEEKQNG